MSRVVFEAAERDLFASYCSCLGRTSRIGVHPVPEPKMSSSRCSIVVEGVVWIGHPERGWRDVIVQQASACTHEHSQIVLEKVASLYAVFQEQSTTLDVVHDVVFDVGVVGAVDVHGPVVGLVYGAEPDIRLRHVPVQMEVDGVSPKSKSLTSVSDFDVAQTGDGDVRISHRRMDHNLASILVTSHLFTKSPLEAGLCGKLTCNRNYFRINIM